MEPFSRYHATYVGRLGVEVGVFVAVDHLRRAGRLDSADLAVYLDVDDWFREELPNPPFYADGNTIGAVTWFKSEAAGGLIERLTPLLQLLDRNGVPHRVSRTASPGRIIYEDEIQVGATPSPRRTPDPLPAGTVLSSTTPGSKRAL